MVKIGITGQAGFIGTHLFNYLSLKVTEIIMVPFRDNYFQNEDLLKNWVMQCDVIVHLAAVNRHADPLILYETNIGLVNQLIKALEDTKSVPHLIFSSSTQEERDNQYGKSKKEGRLLFINWAKKNNALFTGMVIPNVFGPFGNPYYNSVVATFSQQLTHNENTKIDFDGHLKLIYVGELTEEIYKIIISRKISSDYKICHSSEFKVSELLVILKRFKNIYLVNNVLPALYNRFELNLFNTFRSYIDLKNNFPKKLEQKIDDRGTFVETVKLEQGGQVSFSTTKPAITRGNHFHTRKIERFTVIKGEALIQLRKIGSDEILDFKLSGDVPSFVDMPVWYTHSITNIGSDTLFTVFWINEFFDKSDPDTFFENVLLNENS